MVISKSLVERMQGRIGVTSTPDQGSRFFFSLPFDLATAELMEAKPLNIQGISRDFRGTRVLVVEDNEMNQQVAREFLEAEGIMVSTAENGQQALDMLARESFDLIFMDVQMPVMDGLTATTEIRRLEEDNAGMLECWNAGIEKPERNSDISASPDHSEEGPQSVPPAPQHLSIPPSQHSSISAFQHRRIPIIAMTAHALAQAREECLAAGMDDILTKPINRESLLEVLRVWLFAARAGKGDIQPQAGATRGPAETSRTTDEPRSTDAIVTLQARLPGFDVRAGLAFANHNERLYRQLLEKFKEEGHDWDRSLDEALAGEDQEGMVRAAHTIKGLARMLGANGLADAALEVERRARASEPFSEAFDRLKTALGQTLEVLDTQPWSESSAENGMARHNPAPMDREAVMILLDDLRHSLRSDMVQALKQANQLQTLLADTDQAATATALTKDIFDFETDSALRRLDKMAGHIG